MNYPFELVRLHEFVKEIHNYYKLNNQLLSEPFSLTKAMVSFGMAGLSDAELDSLIELLQHDGHLLSAADNTLSFPLSFIEADC
jgi:hypothetical protein